MVPLGGISTSYATQHLNELPWLLDLDFPWRLFDTALAT
jgi:hypothetical protein